MSSSSSKVYFPGLNGLRFFAAIAVVFHHIEGVKRHFGIEPNVYHRILSDIGNHAVTFFFALSGFLITYLLFIEKDVTGTVNVKHFYVRRILRIWPLYFLIVCLSIFILPQIGAFRDEHQYAPVFANFPYICVLYLTFLPNVGAVFFASLPYAYQVWSIGVEEQFYAFWPLLMKKAKKYIPVILGVIAFFLILKFAAIILVRTTAKTSLKYELYNNLYTLAKYTRIQCMAFGALCAFVFYKKMNGILDLVYNKGVQVAAYALTFGLLLGGFKIPYFEYVMDEIFTVLFGIIILNVSTNPRTILNLEKPFLDYLGKISYGIYMYHILAISIVVIILRSIAPGLGTIPLNILLYVLCPLATVALSGLSFKYFEKPFIKAKLGFTKVVSGDNAKEEIKEESPTHPVIETDSKS